MVFLLFGALVGCASVDSRQAWAHMLDRRDEVLAVLAELGRPDPALDVTSLSEQQQQRAVREICARIHEAPECLARLTQGLEPASVAESGPTTLGTAVRPVRHRLAIASVGSQLCATARPGASVDLARQFLQLDALDLPRLEEIASDPVVAGRWPSRPLDRQSTTSAYLTSRQLATATHTLRAIDLTLAGGEQRLRKCTTRALVETLSVELHQLLLEMPLPQVVHAGAAFRRHDLAALPSLERDELQFELDAIDVAVEAMDRQRRALLGEARAIASTDASIASCVERESSCEVDTEATVAVQARALAAKTQTWLDQVAFELRTQVALDELLNRALATELGSAAKMLTLSKSALATTQSIGRQLGASTEEAHMRLACLHATVSVLQADIMQMAVSRGIAAPDMRERIERDLAFVRDRRAKPGECGALTQPVALCRKTDPVSREALRPYAEAALAGLTQAVISLEEKSRTDVVTPTDIQVVLISARGAQSLNRRALEAASSCTQ